VTECRRGRKLTAYSSRHVILQQCTSRFYEIAAVALVSIFGRHRPQNMTYKTILSEAAGTNHSVYLLLRVSRGFHWCRSWVKAWYVLEDSRRPHTGDVKFCSSIQATLTASSTSKDHQNTLIPVPKSNSPHLHTGFS
jgi:hypothetical protein